VDPVPDPLLLRKSGSVARNSDLDHRGGLIVGVGVLLAAGSQSTSKSGYRASFWDP
jgi:hypothetical protein